MFLLRNMCLLRNMGLLVITEFILNRGFYMPCDMRITCIRFNNALSSLKSTLINAYAYDNNKSRDIIMISINRLG